MDPVDTKGAAHRGIRTILDDPSLRGPHLIQAIEAIGLRGSAEPFRLCLRSLTGLDLPEQDARAFLTECERHRDRLEAGLGRDPGLGVALTDHLHSDEASPADPDGGAVAVWGAAAPRAEERFAENLEVELLRAERFERPLALALLAPDGEGSGLIIHRGLSIAREVIRDTDSLGVIDAGRVGVVLPCTGESGARLAAGRLQERLSAATGTTWSVGVSIREDGPGGSRELLERARSSLDAARSAGGGLVRTHRRERRAHPRRRPGEAITGRLQGRWGTEGIELEDLSLGGARLCGAGEVAEGSEVVLTLNESTALPRRVALPGRVIRSRPLSDGRSFEAALRFTANEPQIYRLAGILADLSSSGGRAPEDAG